MENDPNHWHQLPPLRQQPPRLSFGQKLKKLFAPLAFIGIILAKFKGLLIPVLKFLPLILKTGGTMFLSIWVYALFWGWKFAVGFVVLIFIHECGHLIAARMVGLSVSAPMFIPFLGASIAMREMPRNAWMESQVGIGGPILGSIGAALCIPIYYSTGNPLFLALAWTGFWLNLFNLIPISPLDGGRIVTALSPWLWIIGLVGIGYFMITHGSFVAILILIVSLPRVFTLFRPRTAEEARYFEVAPWQRVTMAALYFGLAISLVVGMSLTEIAPPQNDSEPSSNVIAVVD